MRRVRLILTILFFAFGALAVLVFVFYSVEDWRGAREWIAVRRQLEARGESFDPARFIPASIPDEQNLAMAPIFARVLRYRVDLKDGEFTFGALDPTNEAAREIGDMPDGHEMAGKPRPTRTGSWELGQRRDLTIWQTYFRGRPDFPHSADPQSPAADVLLALTRYNPLLDELAREAAARPLTRFPIAWKHKPPSGIALPHLNVLQLLTKTLSLRAIAELRLDRPAEAFADLELCFRLQQSAASEPTLISILVDVTQLGIMLQPIWEGLADRRWTPEQIDRLRTHLRGMDMLSDFKQAVRSERTLFSCGFLDDLRNNRHLRGFVSGARDPASLFGSSGSESLIPVAPGGWFDQNKASDSRFIQEAVLDAVHPETHRVDLGMAQAREASFAREAGGVYTWYLKYAPIFGSLLRKVAKTQANLDCAATAFALEKHWLEHQAYPEGLDALAPAYVSRVPADLIDGASLRYRPTPDGRYELYSIGGNELDEGGAVVPNSTATSADSTQGDWVWRYSAVKAP